MSIILMIILLSILILVHEAGHFLAAKMFKMKVSKFGFGLPIGPTLWEKQVGDVKVLVHTFLLGGYVAFPDDDKELDLPKDSPDRFLNRPIYQRLIVVSAGVTANVICALVLVMLTATLWGQMPSGKYEVYVNQIMAEKNESLKNSGIMPNDKIIKINGSKINSSSGLTMYAQLSKSYDGKADKEFINQNYSELKKINPAFSRDEIIPEEIVIQLPKINEEKSIRLSDKNLKGMKNYQDNQQVLTANQIKLRNQLAGKTYIISDGTITLNDVACAMSDNLRPLNIIVMRDNKEIQLKPVYPTGDGVIGIKLELKEITIPTKNAKSIIKTSCKYLYDQTYMLLYGLYQIFSGKIPLKDLHGIIVITKVGGDIIQNSGIFSGLLLTAIISLDLAIVNFLPIPALDGGHVMFLLIEKIMGKPLDEKTIDKIGTIGFAFLMLLMIFVLGNDIFALVTKQL